MLLKKRQKILTVRLVRFGVQVRGFRTQSVIVVTSLLDVKALPASAIAERSARRWQVELHFRQIKTNLAVEVLRGLSPSMIERESWRYAIADNLVGAWLLEASLARAVPIERLSFKGALDACRPGPIAPSTLAAIAGLARRTPSGSGARPALRPPLSPPSPGRPTALSSPALPTISCPTTPAAASPAPENDGRKITCSAPARAGGFAYPLIGYCDDRRFVFYSMALNSFDPPLLS